MSKLSCEYYIHYNFTAGTAFKYILNISNLPYWKFELTKFLVFLYIAIVCCPLHRQHAYKLYATKFCKVYFTTKSNDKLHDIKHSSGM